MANKLVESSPNIARGKPVVAGTRIKVELVLEKLAHGESIDQILAAHPRLTREAVMAALELPLNHRYMNDYPPKKFYTMQYACFGCRKCFKQRVPYRSIKQTSHVCPQCGVQMWMMGIAFKAPKQTDVKQWRKVEAMRRAGFVFYNNQGRTPRKLNELPPLLRQLEAQAMEDYKAAVEKVTKIYKRRMR